MPVSKISLNEVLNVFGVFPAVYLYIPIFKVIDEKVLMVFGTKYEILYVAETLEAEVPYFSTNIKSTF